MNGRDRFTKRVWLLMLFIYPVLLQLVVNAFVNKAEKSFSGDAYMQLEETLSLGYDSSHGIKFPYLLGAFIMLYFCYYNQGTFLLSSHIYINVFLLLHNAYLSAVAYFALEVASSEQLRSYQSVEVFASMLGDFLQFVISLMLLRVSWIVCCYQMKKVNLKQRFAAIVADEKYRNIFVNLEKFSDPKELEDFYGASVRENPEIESFLTKRYKHKISELSLFSNA